MWRVQERVLHVRAVEQEAYGVPFPAQRHRRHIFDSQTMPETRPPARWSRRVAVIYLAAALTAGVVAFLRLADSTDMPGLAAWELLVLALPWSLVLQATRIGREAGGPLIVAIVLAGVALNAGLLYWVTSLLERRLRG